MLPQPFNQEADAAFRPEVRRAEIDAEHAKVSWYEQLFQVWEGMLMGMLRDWREWDHPGDHYHWNLQVNCQVEKSRMARAFEIVATLLKYCKTTFCCAC